MRDVRKRTFKAILFRGKTQEYGMLIRTWIVRKWKVPTIAFGGFSVLSAYYGVDYGSAIADYLWSRGMWYR